MGKVRFLLLGIILTLTGACATSPPADPAALKGMIRTYESICIQETTSDVELTELLNGLDLTPNAFCNCMGQTVFGSFTQNDFRRFIHDSNKYGEDVGYREPWESRIEIATFRCLGDETISGRQAAL